MYSHPLAHLQAEFRRMDLLLHREILRQRAAYQLALDEFRGLYVSDEQVDALLRDRAGEGGQQDAETLTAQAAELRCEIDGEVPAAFPLPRLLAEFGLSPAEADVLLLALAPEIESKYETLYAYLNNDVTRRWPTYELALRVAGGEPDESVALRGSLLPDGPLLGPGLLVPLPPSAASQAWPGGGFAAAPPLSHHLLGLPPADARLTGIAELRLCAGGWDDLPLPADLRGRLQRIPALFAGRPAGSPTAPVLVLQGQPGSGRLRAAEAVCADIGRRLLRVDLAAARAGGTPWPQLRTTVALLARLAGAGIYLLADADFSEREAQAVHGAQSGGAPFPSPGWLAGLPGPLWLACPPGAEYHDLLAGARGLVFDFGEPEPALRRDLWQGYAVAAGRSVADQDADSLASRFVLTPGQIQSAVAEAIDDQVLSGEGGPELPAGLLFSAARSQSDQSLGALALKVQSPQTWQDLVLPPATLQQVRDIAAAIRNHYLVYGVWGFGQRVAAGRGLKVLFAGGSGTGKTMTAGVIARDLELDLYRIDLSGVVSKYIGETEKNLDRIFRAARSSNAILFFDEADALFGKRSEVKDAHDRYANIETAYLLQKMEEHEGAVILASNLSKNIDEAFSRRMHYVIEFPMPDAAHRERLWRGMFPPEAPLAPDADLRFLAQQFTIAGGDIRNVALDAAFLAAQDGEVISMSQLVRAMARQLLKQGKVPSATDFKGYFPLLSQIAAG